MMDDGLRLSNMSKKIAYVLGAITYGVLFIAYGKEPLLNLLTGLPQQLASILFFAGLIPMFVFLGMSADINTNTQKQRKSANVFWAKQLWRGDVSLPKAFLGYNVLGAFFVTLFAQFLYFRLSNATLGSLLLWGLVFAVFGLGYHIVSTIGTLRSSRIYAGSRAWVSLARFGVILSSVFLVLALIFTGLGVNVFAGFK